MIPEVHTTPDGRQSTGQNEPPPAEPLPASPRDVIEETRREEPTLATPPAPPSDTTGTRRQPAPSGRRWALAIGLTVLGGLSWFIFGWGIAWGTPLIAILSAVVPAVTCLVAGWLLRSWWGLVAAVAVYMAISALMWVLAVAGIGDLQAWGVGFSLSVVLPAVVMAAIGTAFGMYRARRPEQPLRHG